MHAYLRGVIPSRLALSVMEKAAELIDAELPGEIVDHAGRHFGEVLKESAEKTRRAELDGKTEAAVVATM